MWAELILCQADGDAQEEEEGEDADQMEEDTEEEEEDPIFPNFEGIGVYPATAMMNVSYCCAVSELSSHLWL